MNSSDSYKLQTLRSFMEEGKFGFVKEIRKSHSLGIDFAVFVSGDDLADKADKDHTSLRQLKQIQGEILNNVNIFIQWIVIPGRDASALEVSLFELLQKHYPNTFSAVYISSVIKSPPLIWLETNPGVNNLPNKDSVEKIARELFELFGFETPQVEFSHGPEVPTNLVLLRLVKIHSPVSVELLANETKSKRLIIPNNRWLQTKLDSMRRSGLLARTSAGLYTITERALGLVPISKNRTSSDVERALALGRRKW